MLVCFWLEDSWKLEPVCYYDLWRLGHAHNIESGIRRQVPALDQGLAALIEDLDERGLLDSTLVCLASEFEELQR